MPGGSDDDDSSTSSSSSDNSESGGGGARGREGGGDPPQGESDSDSVEDDNDNRRNGSSLEKKECAWWPICNEGVAACGGLRKETCIIFGTNGSQCSQAPSEAEHRRLIRLHTWTPIALEWNCPWLCGKAVDCGGNNKDNCEKYGLKGTHKNSRPTEVELKMKKMKATQAAERR